MSPSSLQGRGSSGAPAAPLAWVCSCAGGTPGRSSPFPQQGMTAALRQPLLGPRARSAAFRGHGACSRSFLPSFPLEDKCGDKASSSQGLGVGLGSGV